MRKRNFKNSKNGFTLVELIVVLVVLGILIAMLVPALTGYIKKAREKEAIAECKLVVTAAQTVMSEKAQNREVVNLIADPDKSAMMDLAEVSGTMNAYKADTSNAYQLSYLSYTASNEITVIYDVEYEANGRDALYTIDDGGSAGGGDKPGDGYDTSKLSNDKLKAFFESGWTTVNDENGNYRYKSFQSSDGKEKYYLVIDKNTDNGHIKKYIEEKEGKYDKIFIANNGKIGNDDFKTTLQKSLGIEDPVGSITIKDGVVTME